MPKIQRKSLYLYIIIYIIYYIYNKNFVSLKNSEKITVITVIVMAIYATSILIQLTTIAG